MFTETLLGLFVLSVLGGAFVYVLVMYNDKIKSNLKIREKSVLSALRKISSYGIPIEIKINKNGEKEVKSSLKEPISYIEKEKASAEKMLSLLGEITPSSSESLNNQRKINYRIYKEYVSNLNELFDKWASLKLID